MLSLLWTLISSIAKSAVVVLVIVASRTTKFGSSGLVVVIALFPLYFLFDFIVGNACVSREVEGGNERGGGGSQSGLTREMDSNSSNAPSFHKELQKGVATTLPTTINNNQNEKKKKKKKKIYG